MFYDFNIGVGLGFKQSFRPCRTQDIPVSNLHGMICGRSEDVMELKSISKSIFCFGSNNFEEF